MSKEDIINQLEELYKRVHGNNNPSQLEIDILKDEIKALYQKVLDWEEQEKTEAEAPQSELHVVQPSSPEPPVETSPPPTEESIAEPTPEPQEPKVEEPEYTPSYEESVQPPQPEPVKTPEPPQPQPTVEIPPQEESTETLPPKVEEAHSTENHSEPPAEKREPNIAERAEAAQPDKSLAAKWHKNPIGDLKSGIGLNEKFAFVRILFKGDLNAYNEVIEKLNTSGNREEALGYLESIRDNHSWDGASHEFTLLKEFVERRYA